MAQLVETQVNAKLALLAVVEAQLAGIHSQVRAPNVPAPDRVGVVAAPARQVEIQHREQALVLQAVVLAEFVGSFGDVARADLKLAARLGELRDRLGAARRLGRRRSVRRRQAEQNALHCGGYRGTHTDTAVDALHV